MAERKATDLLDRDYRLNQSPMTHFPYTHGDVVEAARQQIREEMHSDLMRRKAELESKEKIKLGNNVYDSVYGQQPDLVKTPMGHENEIRLYPQGGNKQAMLRAKF